MMAEVRIAGSVLLFGAAAWLGATTAWAGCADDVAALEKLANTKSHQAVAKPDTPAADQQSEAVKKSGAGAKTVPAPDDSDVTEDKAKAASGGEGAVKAKVILNDAKAALERGDERACTDSVRRAKDQLKG